MDLQLKDKVIFVAGGSRGIGLGIVETCLAEGAKVAFTARGERQLSETSARLADRFGRDRIWSKTGDMRDTHAIEAALTAVEKEFGPIFGAVANVGLHPCPMGFEVDDETWDAGFTQNLDSAFRLARASLRRMTPRKDGAIVFIGSIAGFGALGTPLPHCTAKAALGHLSKAIAKMRGASSIRVTTLAPRNILFPAGQSAERPR